MRCMVGLALVMTLFGCGLNQGNEDVQTANLKLKDSLHCKACDGFDALYLKIRDGLIAKPEAQNEIANLVPQIKKYYTVHGVEGSDSSFTFPVRGYNYKHIGGNNGDGYITAGYDFFDGNKHGGHPAFDIFIYDKDQDCLDDSTGKSVDIMAITSGIIISAVAEWDTASQVRGGVCFILYDPLNDRIYYYAHNSHNYVRTGDIVKKGQLVAVMGRSGLNAYKKRSPTHLHIMCMKIEKNGDMSFVNIWNDLKTASPG